MSRTIGGFSINTSSKLMQSKVLGWVRMMRPLIVFISIFGASVGALNVTYANIPINEEIGLEVGMLVIALLASGFLAGGLMIHNDYTDLESDRVNRAQKPLPSGLISPGLAARVGIGMMIVSIILAFSTTLFTTEKYGDGFALFGFNIPCGLLTTFIVLTGIYYNKKGKYTGLLGHTIVAFGVGAIPLWGAWALRPYTLSDLLIMLPLSLAIFFMEIGREIMVCIGDLEGDIAAGFKTTPVRLGRNPSMFIVLFFYAFFIPFYPIPYYGLFGFDKVFGPLYFVGATLFLLVLIITWLNVWRIVKSGSEENIWNSFERNIRTGTRMGVVFFQIILFMEIFF